MHNQHHPGKQQQQDDKVTTCGDPPATFNPRHHHPFPNSPNVIADTFTWIPGENFPPLLLHAITDLFGP